MKTRNYRTPWSIWIAVGLYLLFAMSKIILLIKLLASPVPVSALPVALGAQAFGVTFALYLALAVARLSRWPVLLTLSMTLPILVVSMLVASVSPTLLALTLNLAPIGMYAACTLPHWRKMNWDLFGRPYRLPEDQVEIFT